MLNIEKYKEELENIGVLNPTELAESEETVWQRSELQKN